MAKRVQNSFGKCHHNKGTCVEVRGDLRYVLDNTREFYLFDVVPVGAVRMTKRDRIFTNPNHIDPLKRQRPAVTKYFAFKNTLTAQALEMGYELGKWLEAVYLIPMPESWSNKKKEKMNGLPCESKPDTDNITKAIKDAMLKNDSAVWWEKAEKRWAYRGSIIIFK
jgi:Holliday junction resolvase RusA-like endonuclease